MESRHIANWLKTPNSGLQDRKPNDLVKDDRVDIIWRIIEETSAKNRRGT